MEKRWCRRATVWRPSKPGAEAIEETAPPPRSGPPSSERSCILDRRRRIGRFLEEHAPRIRRLANAMLRGRRHGVDAVDIAHDVMVTLMQLSARGTFDPARLESVEAYLRAVVRNAARRACSRRRSLEQVLDDGDVSRLADESAGALAPEDSSGEAIDDRRWLTALATRLRPRDLVAFRLLVAEGRAIEDVARTLGTTTNNVYQMRHRILTTAKLLMGGRSTRA